MRENKSALARETVIERSFTYAEKSKSVSIKK